MQQWKSYCGAKGRGVVLVGTVFWLDDDCALCLLVEAFAPVLTRSLLAASAKLCGGLLGDGGRGW